MLVVDKLDKSGTPTHAVLYRHGYGWFVRENDHRNVAAIKKENSKAFDGPFVFGVPHKSSPTVGTTGKGKRPNPRHYIPKGCLARARDAGFANGVAERQLTTHR